MNNKTIAATIKGWCALRLSALLLIDSQSVKTTEVADEHGYDAGKKINGRKRHALVDTLGLALCFKVLAASANVTGQRRIPFPLRWTASVRAA